MHTPLIIYGSSGRVGSKLLHYIENHKDIACTPVGKVDKTSYILNGESYDGLCPLDHVLETLGKTPSIIVDATATKDQLLDMHLTAIRSSPHTLITANKNPLSLY